MILGLTGSIGSGKTFVGDLLEEFGAKRICADRIAREVVAPGSPALQEIAAEFGPAVIGPKGELDRAVVARIVFQDPLRRQALEAIIHPRVRKREEEFVERWRDHPLIILEIPLLFETGAEDLCDKVLVVTVDEEVRFRRLEASRGMTREDIASRLKTQMPQEEKVRRADFFIDNSHSQQSTRDAAERLYHHLTGAPPAAR
ncbi:MAG: dephospho-CoA kinase [Sumerlaeia bacterium]